MKLPYLLTFVILLFSVLPTSLDAQKSPRKKTVQGPVLETGREGPPPPKSIKFEETPKTLGITIEKYTDDIFVNSDGTAEQTWELQQRFSNKLFVSRFSKFERPFNGDLESFEVWDAYILKANGNRIIVPESDIKIRRTPQAEAAPAFSSMMLAEWQFNGVEQGDTIHYKAKLKTLKPYFGNHFDRIDYLQAGFDWQEAEINLSAPADYPLYIQAVELDGGKQPDEGGRSRWQWRKKAMKSVEIEDLSLDYLGSSPRVAITSYKNYDELGAAYWAEARKKAAVTPEVQKLADEITKEANSPAQQASAIYQWVNKNVRYLSLILERGGWVPHDTTEILANRYGDCKDYTTILNALLKAKGIASYPVIIRADLSSWFPDVAVGSYFNHAILYIPTLDLFADATAPNSRLGLIPQLIVGKKAFLAGSKTGVITTPTDRPDDNKLLSSVSIKVAPEGSLKAMAKNTFQGRNELLFRPIFEDSLANSDAFVAIMLNFFGLKGKGRIVHVGNPFEVKDPFTLDLEVDLDHYTTFTPTGTFRIPTGVNFLNIFTIGALTKAEKRKTNLMLGAMTFGETFKVELPEGVTPDAAPAVSEFANAVGSYRSEAVLNGRQVTVTHSLVIKKDEIPPDEYSQAKELFEKASTGFLTEIKYHAVPDLLRAASRDVARQPAPKPETLVDILDRSSGATTISTTKARELEAKLVKDPDDLDAHLLLVRYYTDNRSNETPQKLKARIRHSIWFVEHHPELDEKEVLGILSFHPVIKEPEFTAVKSAWLKQLETDPKSDRMRINAFTYVVKNDKPAAVKILEDGIKSNPDNFEFPIRLSQTFHSRDVLIPESGAEREARQKKELEYGMIAVALLKKERSTSRDTQRKDLLQDLAQTAVEVKNYEAAKSVATELILDFGQDADNFTYASAAHIGNITLGRVALYQGDAAKAAEYLLIAIRAPLRKEKSWLPDIDTTLARELFAAGRKEAVLEYLSLCENLWNLKNEKALFDYQMKALKLWQDQIKQGKTPSFDFQKP